MKSVSALGLLLVVTSGCADREARATARVLLSQTIAYEQLLDEKIKAERKYYQAIVGVVGEALASEAIMEERVIVTTAALDLQDQMAKSKTDLTPEDLSKNVMGVIDATRQQRSRIEGMVTEYNTDLVASLETLEASKAALQKVRKDLEQLQAERRGFDQLWNWVGFWQKTYESLAPRNTSAN